MGLISLELCRLIYKRRRIYQPVAWFDFWWFERERKEKRVD